MQSIKFNLDKKIDNKKEPKFKTNNNYYTIYLIYQKEQNFFILEIFNYYNIF